MPCDDSGEAAVTPPQVLVVDDSATIRQFICLLLRRLGFAVLEAEDGLVARRLLARALPALVISDLEMPVNDGWELLAFCHAQHPGLPVLIVSGATPGRRPEIESWASGFLAKPFDLPRFRSEVERLVARVA